MHKMQTHQGIWNDISFEYLFLPASLRRWRMEIKHHWPWPNGLRQIIESGLDFYDANHYSHELTWKHETWPNAKTIYFVNIEEFIEQHRPGRLHRYQHIKDAQNRWEKIRHSNWPDLPPRSLEAINEPPFVDLQINDPELISYLPCEKTISYMEQVEKDALKNEVAGRAWIHKWDTLWYLDKSAFLVGIEKLYEDLNYDDFNVDYMASLYDIWYKISKNS